MALAAAAGRWPPTADVVAGGGPFGRCAVGTGRLKGSKARGNSRMMLYVIYLLFLFIHQIDFNLALVWDALPFASIKPCRQITQSNDAPRLACWVLKIDQLQPVKGASTSSY